MCDALAVRFFLFWSDAYELVFQQYIHSQGVAHRDLKPEVRNCYYSWWFLSLILCIAQNVLLTRDNPPIVKVADFGLAKAVDSLTMLRV
jgi:ser/thr/tyr protein kinase RAD53